MSIFTKIVAGTFFIILVLIENSYSSEGFELIINKIANNLYQDLNNAGISSLAIVDFTDLSGDVNNAGKFFAEEFTVKFSELSYKFNVIDRTSLHAIMFWT